MIVGTYLEQMLKRRHARQMAEARKRGFEIGFKEGVAERRAELIADLRKWNARRLKAEAKGEPFDEPPPGLDG